MEITLIRHGRPGFELTGWACAAELSAIVDDYDHAAVVDHPPFDATQHALNCHVLVSSDLRRALHSAELLGFDDVHLCDAIFREVALPHFKRGKIVMPILAWVVLLRILSLFGFSRHGESLMMAKQRAQLAATRLIALAGEHERVVLVGHGLINRFIAKELRVRGWSGPTKLSGACWGCGVYRQGVARSL